jgi:hypothetical protein
MSEFLEAFGLLTIIVIFAISVITIGIWATELRQDVKSIKEKLKIK